LCLPRANELDEQKRASEGYGDEWPDLELVVRWLWAADDNRILLFLLLLLLLLLFAASSRVGEAAPRSRNRWAWETSKAKCTIDFGAAGELAEQSSGGGQRRRWTRADRMLLCLVAE
jgi:hypothetical protein